MPEHRIFLGLDAGASKTTGALLDQDGQLLARHSTGGAAVPPDAEPTDAACATLRSAAEALCREAGVTLTRVRWFGVGLNGIDFPDQLPRQHRSIAQKTGVPPERLALVNDGVAALWGAAPRPAAALLQHGSAFTGAFRPCHGQETLFDNLGTGRTFDIREQVNAVISRMLDGRVEPTPLRDRILEHYGVDADEFPERLFRRQIPRERLRSGLHVVIRAWLDGDPAAKTLVDNAAADYALAAKAMVERTGCDSADAVFGGGVIAQMPPEFWDLLTRHVRGHCPNVAVKPPDLAPELGAAIMAAFHDGLPPQAFFERLAHSAGPEAHR